MSLLWSTPLLPNAFARSFAPLPDKKLWQWADENVWLENKAAAESGPYRSSKTPWSRRIQELIQRSEMHCYDFTLGRWITVQVTEINKMKSSQSGITEACLNGIRYRANFRPCNVIYTVDTRETARDISERLKPSLEKLDGDIFTGDDADVGTFTMRLRAMDIWFQGSFSSGKFASKMAPLVICDEIDEHGVASDDTSTTRKASSRKKTADDGLQINLCRPKRKKGPIHRGYLRGNQERLHIKCPHCSLLQPIAFFPEEYETPFSDKMIEIRDEQSGDLVDFLPEPLAQGETRRVTTGRIVFDHCKDHLNRWDKLRILQDTFFECGGCKGRIDEHLKRDLVAEAHWIPTAHGTPGVVSQHINDLYSEDKNSRWGALVLEFLDAKREGRKELQGFYNDRLGLPWTDEAMKLELADLKRSIAAGLERNRCQPYKRGTLPFLTYPNRGASLILVGSDVGGNYAKWSAGVVHPNLEDVAIFDWGEELDPNAVAEIMIRQRWPFLEDPKRTFVPRYGFIDGKFRKTEVYRACLAVPGQRLIPCSGLGGAAARVSRLWSYNQIAQYPRGLKRLDYNDREAKDELFTDRLKKRRRMVWFPLDLEADPEFCAEMTAEELIEVDGVQKWNDRPPPNHYGDTVKNIVTGLRFLTRKLRSEGVVDEGAKAQPAGAASAE